MDISAGEDGDLSKTDQLKKNEENFILFVMIGVIAGACAWIYTSLFKITGYRQGAVSSCKIYVLWSIFNAFRLMLVCSWAVSVLAKAVSQGSHASRHSLV